MYAASHRCVAVLQLQPEAGGWRLAAAARLRGHRRLVSCLDVEAGWVVTGSADKTVRLWRPGEAGGCSYSLDRVLEGHFLKVRPGSCSWCGVWCAGQLCPPPPAALRVHQLGRHAAAVARQHRHLSPRHRAPPPRGERQLVLQVGADT